MYYIQSLIQSMIPSGGATFNLTLDYQLNNAGTGIISLPPPGNTGDWVTLSDAVFNASDTTLWAPNQQFNPQLAGYSTTFYMDSRDGLLYVSYNGPPERSTPFCVQSPMKLHDYTSPLTQNEYFESFDGLVDASYAREYCRYNGGDLLSLEANQADELALIIQNTG